MYTRTTGDGSCPDLINMPLDVGRVSVADLDLHLEETDRVRNQMKGPVRIIV